MRCKSIGLNWRKKVICLWRSDSTTALLVGTNFGRLVNSESIRADDSIMTGIRLAAVKNKTTKKGFWLFVTNRFIGKMSA